MGQRQFYYMQPNQKPSQLNQAQPWLKILAGIRLYDATDAWRYFPVSLMGEKLADYLTEALQGGQVDNATLVYNGNPHDFPYKIKRVSSRSMSHYVMRFSSFNRTGQP